LKDRAQRLQEIQRLRSSYEDTFSWEKQCEALVQKMWGLVDGEIFICDVVSFFVQLFKKIWAGFFSWLYSRKASSLGDELLRAHGKHVNSLYRRHSRVIVL